MEKTFSPSDWPLGDQTSRLVKVANSRLGFYYGKDRHDFVKVAGEIFTDKSREEIRKMASNLLPMHITAMGSTEGYGPNRNADGFTNAMLAKYANTFVTSARYYRNHKNKNPDIHYGRVKMAEFEPAMMRVNLLAALYRDKEAAKKGGGLVADKEAARLERGEDQPTSMAIHVPYDVCSRCMNKAATRKDYCESKERGGKCSGFGCRTGLTKVSEDGHIQHVDNPIGTFFDISSVINNADRISFGHMLKAASKEAAYVLGGAERAELLGVTSSYDYAVSVANDPEFVKAAYCLALAEEGLTSLSKDWTVETRLSLAFSTKSASFGESGKDLGDGYLSSIAKLSRFATLPEFLSCYSSQEAPNVVSKVARCLPGVYNRLLYDINNGTHHRVVVLGDDSGVLMDKSAGIGLDNQQDLVVSAAIVDRQPTFDVGRRPAEGLLKTAADELAKQYASYTVDFLSRCSEDRRSDLVPLLIAHNYSVT